MLVVDHTGQIVGDEQIGGMWRLLTQHHDLTRNAGFTQLHGLLHECHAQTARASCKRLPSALQCPMAIGIGLDDDPQFGGCR
ncbi:MAG: hypothetical protein EB130_09645 [Actinobacteria bacterium]|nr:hypothetical protein [Actinomycetota bacterium]